MLSFQVAGAYAMPEVQGSADWLKACDIKPEMPWFFYGGPTDVLEKRIDGIRRFGEDIIAKMN